MFPLRRGQPTLLFWLWMVADMCGYASPFWIINNQASKLGGQVRKGEKSTIANFYRSYIRRLNLRGIRRTRRGDAARPQGLSGLQRRLGRGPANALSPAATIEIVEPEGREREFDSFFAGVPATLRHYGNEAYLRAGRGSHHNAAVAPLLRFDLYCTTLAHELSHHAVTRLITHWP